MGESGNARVVFWIMLLAAWPFALWQVFCIVTGRPVPFGQYKAGLMYVEVMRDGVFDPDRVRHAWTLFGMEVAVFAVITFIAWMYAYYRGQKY